MLSGVRCGSRSVTLYKAIGMPYNYARFKINAKFHYNDKTDGDSVVYCLTRINKFESLWCE